MVSLHVIKSWLHMKFKNSYTCNVLHLAIIACCRTIRTIFMEHLILPILELMNFFTKLPLSFPSLQWCVASCKGVIFVLLLSFLERQKAGKLIISEEMKHCAINLFCRYLINAQLFTLLYAFEKDYHMTYMCDL